MSTHETMRVPYAQAVYGKAEIRAAMRVFENPSKIVAGPAVKQFEKKIANLFGKQHGVMVNSGSSANLLALAALDLPPHAEVITPALTFSTTLAPILQLGLTPVFTDVEPGTYVINAGQVEALITRRTRALMVPSLIGNLPDWARLRAIARKHDLRLIEDSCDTLGARFRGLPTGAYSDVSTTSFYASHIITAAGGGGMACFRDAALARRARLMAYWGRESTLFGAYEQSEELRKRFRGKLAGRPYDAKFIFSEIGYNFQPTEAQAAFGLAQLARLPAFAARRRARFRELVRFFRRYAQFFIPPRALPGARTSWLAFPLTIRSGAPFTRLAITRRLEERNIQTRPIFTGNVLRQPAFRRMARKRVARRGYPVADAVMQNSFLIGCHQGLTARQVAYLERTVSEFLEPYVR